jgi:hypothetical protein
MYQPCTATQSLSKTKHLVIDSCVDAALLNEIEKDNLFFPIRSGTEKSIAQEINGYHDKTSSDYSPFMFWEGWHKSAADTLKKKVIKNMWESRLPMPLDDVAGFEYWTRTFAPGQYLDVHVDEDTFAYSRDKSFNAPAVGCVFYGGKDTVIGGELQLHNSCIEENPFGVLERDSLLKLSSLPGDRVSVKYRYNRTVFFDAGRTLHNTLPAAEGIRKVMVVNVWHRDAPPAGLVLGEFYYE